ncbi:MAG: DUF2341 domain-containing protein [Halobacteriota archaeon]|nr:DUF2341 domain-containing protein [Halobacteriota archaeon]
MRGKLIIFGMVFLILLSAMGAVSALQNSDDSDWKYYEEITIKENSGESLRDYQVLIELNSDNFNFSKASDDGSDLRFYDAKDDELDFWIEEYDPGDEVARIWVKVSHIPSNGESVMKMYYGNEKVYSLSDGEDTFEFFDDFEGTKLDKNRWETNAESLISVENGILYLWDDWTDYLYYLSTHEKFRTPVVVEARVKLACVECGSDLEVGFVDYKEDNRRYPDTVFAVCDWEGKLGYKSFYYKGADITSSKQKIRTDDWFNIKIEYTDDKIGFWDSYTEGTQTYRNTMNDPFYLALAGDTDSYRKEDAFDWIFIRKYASKEPTLTFKEEEIEEEEGTGAEGNITENQTTSHENITQENITHECMSRGEISELINSVTTNIDVLNRKDIDTSLIEVALNNAIDAYDTGRDEDASELVKNAKKMADDTYEALSEHIEPAQLVIDEAKSLGADVKEAEDKLEEADDALSKGNYEYAMDWADNALELAKNATVSSVKITDLIALSAKYDQYTVMITGTIKDINAVYGKGYTFALDDGSGMISVSYKGILGDIQDGDRVTVHGVFQVTNGSGSIVADDVQSGGGTPGFEAVFTIAGVLAVAYLIRRRR